MMEEPCMSGQSTKTSMEHVLIPRHTASDHDQIKGIGCRLNCRVRKLTTNKGAIYLILVWNYLLISTQFYLFNYTSHTEVHLLMVGLTLHFAGWLADIRFGCYKVIHWSMWIMWVGSMLATASSVIVQCVDGYQYANKRIVFVLLMMMYIGFGGYQTNVI